MFRERHCSAYRCGVPCINVSSIALTSSGTSLGSIFTATNSQALGVVTWDVIGHPNNLMTTNLKNVAVLQNADSSMNVRERVRKLREVSA